MWGKRTQNQLVNFICRDKDVKSDFNVIVLKLLSIFKCLSKFHTGRGFTKMHQYYSNTRLCLATGGTMKRIYLYMYTYFFAKLLSLSLIAEKVIQTPVARLMGKKWLVISCCKKMTDSSTNWKYQ